VGPELSKDVTKRLDETLLGKTTVALPSTKLLIVGGSVLKAEAQKLIQEKTCILNKIKSNTRKAPRSFFSGGRLNDMA
jgi:hypothetical protein